jgi:hypothetical protein
MAQPEVSRRAFAVRLEALDEFLVELQEAFR